MDINQLEYFLVCARCGSLTRAAEELYTTQPHVSMVIKSLEEELGLTLFDRKPRGVELTEAGRQICEYAADALKNTELILSVSKKKEHSRLRIATNPSSYMAVLLTDYYLEHQEEDFSLEYTECGIEEMLALVSEQEYNMGFLFVPEHKKPALFHMLERRHMEFVPLLEADLVLYVGRKHPLYGASAVTREQLAELRFIQLEDDFFAVEDMLNDLPRSRRKKQLLNRTVRTNSNHMMIQMLQRTELCNLGSFWLKDCYRQYDFGRIPVEGFQGKVAFGYVRHCVRPLRPEEKNFLEFIQAVMRRDAQVNSLKW